MKKMKIQSDLSRQEILQRIGAAGKKRPAIVNIQSLSSDEIYKTIQPDSLYCFKNELEAVNGRCILCDNESDVYEKIKIFFQQSNFQELFCRDTFFYSELKNHGIPVTNLETHFETMQAGVTGCEFLVARTGSVLVSSNTPIQKQMNVFPPVHIVIAHASQLVDYLEEALVAIQNKYADSLPAVISTITGPSRTADIEKTLVLGAHGPKEFIVFLSKV